MTTAAKKALKGALSQMSLPEKLESLELIVRSMKAQSVRRSGTSQRTALERLRRELAALPVSNPSDGFRSSEHDKVLYGGGS